MACCCRASSLCSMRLQRGPQRRAASAACSGTTAREWPPRPTHPADHPSPAHDHHNHNHHPAAPALGRLPQRPLHAFGHLTSTERETFDRARLSTSSWYGHRLTTVLLVDTPPPAKRRAHTNLCPYELRGWCDMEARASALVKDVRALLSLKRLSGEEERCVINPDAHPNPNPEKKLTPKLHP